MAKSQSERAQDKFDRYSKQFDSLDDFTAEVLMGFCITCAQIDMLNEVLEKEGIIVPDAKHGSKEHPALNTKHKLEIDKARGATHLRRILVGNGSDEPSIADDWS